MKIIGYTRVSTQEQADSGAGLDAQRKAIEDDCARRDLTLVEIIEDAGYSGKSFKRPGIEQAMRLLQEGQAQGLMVARLDRLSRSLLDFASLMERARKEQWSLIALDLGVDTSTPSGEMMASVLATFAQFERRLIGQRTKDALAIRRAQGVTLGRRRSVDIGTVDLILSLRSGGKTYEAIADELNTQGVSTGQGGKCWYPSTVHAIVNRS